jgi:hypothetical protein
MVPTSEGRLSAGAVSESAAYRVVLTCEEVCETSDSSLSLACRRAVGGVSEGAARCSDAASTEVNKTSSGSASACPEESLHVAPFLGRKRSGRPLYEKRPLSAMPRWILRQWALAARWS